MNRIFAIWLIAYSLKVGQCAEGSEMPDEHIIPFIPARLDDYGLTAAEFRVFCRVCRRGDCTESVPNMSKGCRLHADTISAALGRLVILGVLTKEKRPGQTSVYRANPAALLHPNPPETKGWVSESTHPKRRGDTHRKTRVESPPKRVGDYPPEREGDEVSPLKCLPLSVSRKGETVPPPTEWKVAAPAVETVIAFGAVHEIPEAICRQLHEQFTFMGMWQGDDGKPRSWRSDLFKLSERVEPLSTVSDDPPEVPKVIQHFLGLRNGLSGGQAEKLARAWFDKHGVDDWRGRSWRKASSAWFFDKLPRPKV